MLYIFRTILKRVFGAGEKRAASCQKPPAKPAFMPVSVRQAVLHCRPEYER